jgi:hypothetical protein
MSINAEILIGKLLFQCFSHCFKAVLKSCFILKKNQGVSLPSQATVRSVFYGVPCYAPALAGCPPSTSRKPQCACSKCKTTILPNALAIFQRPIPLVKAFENARRPLYVLPSRSAKKPPAFPTRPTAQNHLITTSKNPRTTTISAISPSADVGEAGTAYIRPWQGSHPPPPLPSATPSNAPHRATKR